jgi:hypothetical protein
MDSIPGLKMGSLRTGAYWLLLIAIFFIPPASASPSLTLAHAEEFTLPTYLKGVLAEQFPIVDLMPSGERGFWLISKGSLWLWRLEAKGLTHINLDQGEPSHAPLQVLGSDGIGIFAASASSLFQITWPDRRVFRYSLPKGPNESSLGFSGSGDDFRIIHTRGILRFDRYGKTVKLEHPFQVSLKDGKFKYHPQDKTLWRIQGKVLEQASLDEQDLKFKMLLKTHYPLADLSDDGNGMAVHTPYALLRVNAAGKIIKSIPVEGRRSLLAININQKAHAFIFSDGVIEIYKTSQSTLLSAKINLPAEAKIKKLIVEDDLIGVLTDIGVHAFKIVTNN